MPAKDTAQPNVEDTGRTGGDHQTTNNNAAGSGAPGHEPIDGHPEAEASADASRAAADALRDAPARQGGALGPGPGPAPGSGLDDSGGLARERL